MEAYFQVEAKFSGTSSKRIHVKKRVRFSQTQWEHALSNVCEKFDDQPQSRFLATNGAVAIVFDILRSMVV